MAEKAVKYFNNTYIYTSKIMVSMAESVDTQKAKYEVIRYFPIFLYLYLIIKNFIIIFR